MAKVTFPFRVKSGGKYYAPGELVEVENVDDAIMDGATPIPEEQKSVMENPQSEEQPKRGRTKKS